MNNEKEEEKYNLSLESIKELERNNEDIKDIQTYLNTLLYFRRIKLYNPINVKIISKFNKICIYS